MKGGGYGGGKHKKTGFSCKLNTLTWDQVESVLFFCCSWTDHMKRKRKEDLTCLVIKKQSKQRIPKCFYLQLEFNVLLSGFYDGKQENKTIFHTIRCTLVLLLL